MARVRQTRFWAAGQAADRTSQNGGRTRERLPRLDTNPNLRESVLRHCRLRHGDIWSDPVAGHRVAVLDCSSVEEIGRLMGDARAPLGIHDPPYNLRIAGTMTQALPKVDLDSYLEFTRKWVGTALSLLASDAHFYVWIGADYREGFQPLPDFMLLMRSFPKCKARNFITLRNQRGFGTQKNWMWVRQELLHYVVGDPKFQVVYTEIPKVVRGYYKTVHGRCTENIERSRSETIRPGNVWIDVQQVFYRMEENVPGCYAQKPLKAIGRLIESSSQPGDLVVDFFSHSGTTLLAGERAGRRVYTCDLDPVYAELTIRRLEHYRRTGRTGWQWENPFPEIERP